MKKVFFAPNNFRAQLKFCTKFHARIDFFARKLLRIRYSFPVCLNLLPPNSKTVYNTPFWNNQVTSILNFLNREIKMQLN